MEEGKGILKQLTEFGLRLIEIEKVMYVLYNPEINNGIIPRIEKCLDNHLLTHEKISKNWGDKLFKIGVVVFNVVLTILLIRLYIR